MKSLATGLLIIAAGIFGSCTHVRDKNPFEKQFLKSWTMQSSLLVKANDGQIAGAGYTDDTWFKVEVPTTVLRALVKEGVYPDPHLDVNNFKIPDASDELNERLGLAKYSHIPGVSNPFKDPWWFRTAFEIPRENADKHVWLNFDGINYRADVWVNGHKVADREKMVGAFLRFKLDITKYVNNKGKNVLAVKIYQVDHPGAAVPGKQFDVFGQSRGYGEEMYKDATIIVSSGWDCAPVVRDRNMGIYQDVFLTYTGDVDIVDPYVDVVLPGQDTTLADLTIHAELVNISDKPVKGVLKGSIDLMKEVDFYTYTKKMPGTMDPVSFEKELEIPAGKTLDVRLSKDDFPSLSIKNPHLWWPKGYGPQYLHNLKLSFVTEGKPSDEENTMFGIREIKTTLKEIDGTYGRVFWVNGKKVFVRGGWLQPDMMFDMNKKRWYAEARLIANAGIDIVANEEMPPIPNHVVEAFDKYGLLFWETLFPCSISYPGREKFKYPLDADLAIRGAQDMIKRYRHHASLALWAFTNEVMLREAIYVPVRKLIKEMVPSAPFIPTTCIRWDVDSLTPYIKPDLPLGTTDISYPGYNWQPNEYYYNMVLKVKDQMLRNELGCPSVPVLSSMQKMIFHLGEGEKNAIYPLDSVWAYHGAWDKAGVEEGYAYKDYDDAIRNYYGQPETVSDYIREAQYVNAGAYRAIYEAANHRMWDITQGVLIWKLNSIWPTVVWQIYDWFLNPTSAYYFTQKALEPVHIQLNENDFTVSVINTTYQPLKEYTATVKVLDFDLKVLWEKEDIFTMGENRYKELFKLPEIKGLSTVYFVKLELKDARGKTISDNFYWFSSRQKPDFRALSRLKPVDLVMNTQFFDENTEYLVKVRVENTSGRLAFMNRLMVCRGKGGEEVLPTIWSDNFFTLLPGEKKDLTARVAKEDLNGKEPFVVQDKY